jgi:hypothetical protein
MSLSELEAMLDDGEQIEAVVFGHFGWDSGDREPGYGEPDPMPIPFDMRGKILTLEQAEPYFEGWDDSGVFREPTCYAIHVWTNLHVYYVHEYDWSTRLMRVPRNPVATLPGLS